MKIRRQKFSYCFGLTFLLFGLLCVPVQPAEAAALTQDSILNLINRARAEHQLPTLETNALLATAARNKLTDMLAHRYFAHENPDGLMPWDFMEAAGYNYRYAGENLAADYEEADAVVQDWLNSSTHRQNIFNKNFQDTGLAITEANGHSYIVQLFGATINVQRTPARAEARTAPEKIDAILPPAPTQENTTDVPPTTTLPANPLPNSIITDNQTTENHDSLTELMAGWRSPSTPRPATILGVARVRSPARRAAPTPTDTSLFLFMTSYFLLSITLTVCPPQFVRA